MEGCLVRGNKGSMTIPDFGGIDSLRICNPKQIGPEFNVSQENVLSWDIPGLNYVWR
jgi:hypothetical protein